MQIEGPVDSPSASLPVSQHRVQAARNELVDWLPTADESRRPLQNEMNRHFIQLVSFKSFRQAHIPLRDLLTAMPNLRYVLRGLGAAISGQTNVDELLRKIVGFGCRTQAGLTNSRQRVVNSS